MSTDTDDDWSLPPVSAHGTPAGKSPYRHDAADGPAAPPDAGTAQAPTTQRRTALVSEPVTSESAVWSPLAKEVFDQLLSIGVDRPRVDPSTVTEVHDAFTNAAAAVAAVWPDPVMSFTKSTYMSFTRCPSAFLHARSSTSQTDSVTVSAAAGSIAHKAILIRHVRPALSPIAAVRAAVSACCDDPGFGAAWQAAGDGVQADAVGVATARLSAFADAFPPLEDAWFPRFEEPMTARAGAVRLQGKPDLVLGRARDDGRATMLLCDFKSGDLKNEHVDEADFYAVLCVLRHRVVPFRSFVFSLSSGTWTAPDVTHERLVAAAGRIGEAAHNAACVLSGTSPPVPRPGHHCRYCPIRDTCPAALADDQVRTDAQWL